MKVFVILAVICAVAAAADNVPVGNGAEPALNSTLPSNQPNQPSPPKPNHVGARNGRYILLQNGGVYDRAYDLLIPSNAQYVVQQGTGGNRDIYLRTVPVNSVRREYILSTA